MIGYTKRKNGTMFYFIVHLFYFIIYKKDILLWSQRCCHRFLSIVMENNALSVTRTSLTALARNEVVWVAVVVPLLYPVPCFNPMVMVVVVVVVRHVLLPDLAPIVLSSQRTKSFNPQINWRRSTVWFLLFFSLTLSIIIVLNFK